MALTTTAKEGLNRVLSAANLRVQTLTAERAELERLQTLLASGHFDRPIFPVPEAFKRMDAHAILGELPQHTGRFESFRDAAKNDVGYCFDNDYFRSPDAEVLYTMVRKFRPVRIVEVGSGNSTKISRQAIIDGRLSTRIVSIDPQPRVDIGALADEIIRERVETQQRTEPFEDLQAGDVLFIDSSHELKPGNDCAFLYLAVLPLLKPGVLIHIHDIFLPYEYPEAWIIENQWQWTEQYLLQAILSCGGGYEVLWAGHYLQRTLREFSAHFPSGGRWDAQSLWLRKFGG